MLHSSLAQSQGGIGQVSIAFHPPQCSCWGLENTCVLHHSFKMELKTSGAALQRTKERGLSGEVEAAPRGRSVLLSAFLSHLWHTMQSHCRYTPKATNFSSQTWAYVHLLAPGEEKRWQLWLHVGFSRCELELTHVQQRSASGQVATTRRLLVAPLLRGSPAPSNEKTS